MVFLESDVDGSPKVAVDAMLELEEGSSLTEAECFDDGSPFIDDDLDAEWWDLEDDPVAAAPHAPPPLSRLTSFLTSSMLPIDDEDELLNRNKSDLVRHT